MADYHRALQQFNYNASDDNDREAGFVSLGLLSIVILLGLSMFLCNVLIAKFCPSRGSIDNEVTADATYNEDTRNLVLPYSSEIRRLYLETTLKSQEFRSSTNSSMFPSIVTPDVIDATATMGNGDVDIEKAIPNIISADSINTVKTYDTDAADVVDHVQSDDVVEDDNVPQCLICFENFGNGDAVTTHCTNKSYHRHCIMEWLMKHDTCPYCRSPFFHANTKETMSSFRFNGNDNSSATILPVSTAIASTSINANENDDMTR